MSQKLIYVAGPFRAPDCWQVQQNVMAAMELALKVWQAGHVAICPHANTMFYQGACPDDYWLKGDLEILRRCDAVVMVGDWIASDGAKGEESDAIEHGIPVFYGWDDLAQWLAGEYD